MKKDRKMFKRFIHLSLIGASFAALMIPAGLSAQELKVSFAKIQDQWEKFSPNSNPVASVLFKKYLADGKWLALDGTTAAVDIFNPVSNESTRTLFPVLRFQAADVHTYLQAQARIGLLHSMLDEYLGPRQEIAKLATSEQQQQKWQEISTGLAFMKTAHDMERFTLTIAAFSLTDSMSRRCQYWETAHSLGQALGFANPKKSPTFSFNSENWTDYYSSLSKFYLDDKKGFRRVPSDICKYIKVNGKADTLNQIRAGVDERIASDMEKATRHYKTLLENEGSELKQAVTDSQIVIPVRGLFALERGFRDSFDLLDIVRSDLLNLHSGENSLLAQISKAQKEMQTHDAEMKAQSDISNFEKQLLAFLDNLAALPRTDGLTEAQKVKLSPCGKLSILPKAGQDSDIVSFQTNYRNCLTQTVSVYKSLKSVKRDDPTTLEFADHLSRLTTRFKP
jgi:hypothetical protein